MKKSWLGLIKREMAVLATVATAGLGCDRVREWLPDNLPGPLGKLVAEHQPVASAQPALPAPIAPGPQPEKAVAAPLAAPDALVAPPAPPLTAATTTAVRPAVSRADRALSTLRQAGLALPDGAVTDEGSRLTLRLDAADADNYQDELAAQWALGFATLAASSKQVAIVTSIDGHPMVDLEAAAADVELLAAGSIDTGEFFRRVVVRRLGPEPDASADIQVIPQERAPAAGSAPTTKPTAAARPARPAQRVPPTVRPTYRPTTGRAPR